MTDSTASQPPGWYHAQGDPAGTQRYWDGSQWVGGPQAAQDSAVEAGGYGQPAYGGTSALGTPATYGSRVVAALIDYAISVIIMIASLLLGMLFGFVSETLGSIVFVLGSIVAALAFPIWNSIFRQGQTGQTVGKSKQNIKLVSDESAAPIGAGMAIVRYLLGGLLISLCYLDLIWPFFDEQNKRLTDKLLNFSVVDI